MKLKLVVGLLVLVALCQCMPPEQEAEYVYMFSYFKNNGEDGLHLAYSTDGYKWEALNDDKSFLKPELSNDKLMRDPCIIQGPDGRFHMVFTISWNERSIGYTSSEDLINWTEQKLIPVMTHEENARNCWAPEVTYDEKGGFYMIYWATTITGRDTVASQLSEDNYNHRMFYVTTKDFNEFSETKVLYDKQFNVIDATIIPDNGRYVMFLKDETLKPAQKNIKMAIGENLTGPYSDASQPISGNDWGEGPTVLRMGDEWLVYFDKYGIGKFGAVKSNDLKTWTDISGQISIPEGLRHGTIFKVKKEVLENIKKEKPASDNQDK